MKPFSPIAPFWYTPDGEPEENPTRFLLKPLTQEQVEMLSDVDGVKGFYIPPKNYAKVLRYGVIDWENFDGKFSIEKLSKIPPSARIELALELINKSFLSEDVTKNS